MGGTFEVDVLGTSAGEKNALLSEEGFEGEVNTFCVKDGENACRR